MLLAHVLRALVLSAPRVCSSPPTSVTLPSRHMELQVRLPFTASEQSVTMEVICSKIDVNSIHTALGCKSENALWLAKSYIHVVHANMQPLSSGILQGLVS